MQNFDDLYKFIPKGESSNCNTPSTIEGVDVKLCTVVSLLLIAK